MLKYLALQLDLDSRLLMDLRLPYEPGPEFGERILMLRLCYAWPRMDLGLWILDYETLSGAVRLVL